MPQALAAAGGVLHVDRILVLEFAPSAGKQQCLMLRYQWMRTGVMPFDQAVLSDFRLDNPDITEWLAPLRRGEHLSSSRQTTNVTVARIFKKMKLASILLMPIIVEGQYWGHLSFYSSDSIRIWSGLEIDTLRLLANSIGAGIQRADRIKQLAETIDTVGLSNNLLTEVIESSDDGILVANNINKILAYNHRFLEMWSISPERAAAGIDEKLLVDRSNLLKDPEAYVANIRFQHAHRTDVSTYETEFNDGRVFNERTTVLRHKDGRYIGRIWFYYDTTARKAAEQKVIQLSRTDHLTDLPNRRVFIEALQRAISRAGRGGNRFAILYLDLDHFKDVNDTLGHKIGDDLLIAVGRRLLSTVRAGDVVARFGGDEFAILQTDIKDPTQAAILATTLLDSMAEPFFIGSNEIRSGTSIGITIGSPETTDSGLLLSHADLALYGAKSEGRGGYRFFAESMDTETHARVKLVSELRLALAKEQLALYYQPQVP
jgi:diguanylate cyclase (GGDEF)-like protein